MKIMYCVAGEGRGHASRTIPIIQHLKEKGHKIELFAGDRSFPLLQNFKPRKISSLRIIYVNNSVSNVLSFIVNFLRLPWHIFSILKLAFYMLKNKPDVLINDFEIFSNYLAKLFMIPIITIDNENILNAAKCEIQRRFWLNATKVKLIVKLLSPFANKQIIPTFFYPKLKSKRAILVPPVIRTEIINLKPKTGSHILVYQTSKSNKTLVPALRQFKQTKFIVYGLGKQKDEKNIKFVDDEQKKFLSDLADCNAVITNGGFNLITEALLLRKPVLSLPVIGQFEQVLNAAYLQKLGFGMCSFSTNTEIVRKFVEKKEKFREQLKKLPKHSNKPFFDVLDEALCLHKI